MDKKTMLAAILDLDELSCRAALFQICLDFEANLELTRNEFQEIIDSALASTRKEHK